MIEWLIANKAWLFSGILVALPLAIIGWLFMRRSIVQKQKAGHSSVNIQGTGDVTVKRSESKPGPNDDQETDTEGR